MVELPSHPLVATVSAADDTAMLPVNALDDAITKVPDPDLVSVVAPVNWIGLEIVSTDVPCETVTVGAVPPKVRVPPPIPKLALELVRLTPLAQTPVLVTEILPPVLVKRAVLVTPLVELHGLKAAVFHPALVTPQPNDAFVFVYVAPNNPLHPPKTIKNTTSKW